MYNYNRQSSESLKKIRMEMIMIEGKTIAITRSREDSEEFIELMTKDGAQPLSLPTIE